MTRFFFCAVVFMCLIHTQVIFVEAEESKPRSILIVYTSGQPSEWGPFTREFLDAVTGATGISYNTKTIAADLEKELESRGIQAEIVDALELKSHDIIFEHSVLVLGTPVRYAHVTWEMKKFIDEIMWRIAHLESSRFRNWPVAVYVLHGSSAKPVFDYLEYILTFFNTSIKARIEFLLNDNTLGAERKVQRFADQIIELLPEPPADVTNFKIHDND